MGNHVKYITALFHKAWFPILSINIILFSLGSFLLTGSHYHEQQVQFHHWDSGDFRYLAELVWHIPHDYSSYAPVFAANWGYYLNTIPFRGIGVGTYYLAIRAVVTLINPAWGDNAALLGLVVSVSLKFLQVVAYMFLALTCRKRYGVGIAFLCVFLLTFPVSRWEFTQNEHLCEPLLRVMFVLLVSLVISIRDVRSLPVWKAVAFPCLLLTCIYVKAQWSLYPLFMLPAFFLIYRHYALPVRAIGIATASMLAIPLSLVLFNGAVWGDFTLTPGAALHANFKTQGGYMAYICGNPGPTLAVFCNHPDQLDSNWRVYTGPDASAEAFRTLDAGVMKYYLQSPRQMAADFFNGLRYASNYPTDLPSLIIRLADIFTWILLCLGLFWADTCLLAVMGLGLWMIPASANIFAMYDPRYYVVMSGIPLVLATFIFLEMAQSYVLQRKSRFLT